MDGGKKVWVPHPVEGFKLGRIADIGSDLITVEPFDAPGTVSPLLHIQSHDKMDIEINIVSYFTIQSNLS